MGVATIVTTIVWSIFFYVAMSRGSIALKQPLLFFNITVKVIIMYKMINHVIAMFYKT